MEKFELSTDEKLDALLWEIFISYKESCKEKTKSLYALGIFEGAMLIYSYVTKINPVAVDDALEAQYKRRIE